MVKILKALVSLIVILLLPVVLAVAGLFLGLFLWIQIGRLFVFVAKGGLDDILKNKKGHEVRS